LAGSGSLDAARPAKAGPPTPPCHPVERCRGRAKFIEFSAPNPSRCHRLDTKLGKFEDCEIDKRLQLEVRVSGIEKHLGLDKKILAHTLRGVALYAC
jgi:hypothetical protein